MKHSFENMQDFSKKTDCDDLQTVMSQNGKESLQILIFSC